MYILNTKGFEIILITDKKMKVLFVIWSWYAF